MELYSPFIYFKLESCTLLKMYNTLIQYYKFINDFTHFYMFVCHFYLSVFIFSPLNWWPSSGSCDFFSGRMDCQSSDSLWVTFKCFLFVSFQIWSTFKINLENICCKLNEPIAFTPCVPRNAGCRELTFHKRITIPDL